MQMLRLVKGGGGEREPDRRSIASSLGSRSSLAPARSCEETASQAGPPRGLGKLHQAAWRGDTDRVKKLLKKFDMNSLDSEGR